MNFSDLIKIGTLGSALDRDGMIRFKLLPEYLDVSLTDLFLIFKNKKVRYVSVIKEGEKHGMRLLLDDTEVMTEAAVEKGVVLALPSSELVSIIQQQENDNLIGYHVYQGDILLGKVSEEYDNGSHEVITVLSDKNEEFMIPVVEKYIRKVDHETATITVEDIDQLRYL